MLGEAAAALRMGARERALYLRQLVKGRQAGDADILEEEDATIAGNNVAALRSWFRLVRAPTTLNPTSQSLGFGLLPS